MIQQAVAALASKRERLGNLDYAIIDSALLSRAGTQVRQVEGDTHHNAANRFHYDIMELTATGVFALMRSITPDSITRVPLQQVGEWLRSAIDDGHINKDSLNPSLARKLE